MFGIIKKDFKLYAIYFLMFAFFPILDISLDGMERAVITGFGNITLINIVFASAAIELMEDHSHGYKFLNSIPITSFQIVMGKHVLILFFSILCLIFGLTLVILFPISNDFYVLSRGYLIVMANLCILLGAFNYFLLQKFGFNKLLKTLIFIIPIIFMMAPLIILLKYGKMLRNMDLGNFVKIATLNNLLLISVLSLITFFLLINFSTKLLAKKEF